MTPEQLKSAPSLVLKPNPYFVQPELPFLYQKRMILMQIIRPRMTVGDDVGLGKTLESLIAFTYMKARKPSLRALVLTERLALKQWVNEVKKFTVGLSTRIITSGTYPDPVQRISALRQNEADIIVSGYGQMYGYSHYFMEGLGPDWVLIADEPNYFKNNSTLLWKNMRGMVVGGFSGEPYRVVREKNSVGVAEDRIILLPKCSIAQRSYGLTATIIENKLEEAYGVMSIVSPHAFSSLDQFEKDYCIKRKIKKGVKKTVGYKNLDRFRRQIEPFFYGRLQDDPEVEQDLPEVLAKDLPIEMGREQSKKVLEAMDRIIEMPGGDVKQVQILPSMILAQQLVDYPSVLGFNLPSAKGESLMETLTNSLSGERVMIFSKLRRVVDALEKDIKKAGLDCVRITGAEDEAQRERAAARFMSDGRDRCNIILGTKAIQKAVNLQKGGHLFLFDIPWSYGWYRQLVGRLKRTGSIHKSIGVYRMLATLHPSIAQHTGSEATIDQYSLDTVLKKFGLFKAVTGDATEIASVTSDVADIWNAIRVGSKGLTVV